MELRPYQTKCVESVQTGFNEFNRQLIVVPTGGGKTIIFAALAKQCLPRRTLILAHREELIDQAIEKIQRSTGLFAQKEKAESQASLSSNVVVASIQTMQRRLSKWPKDHFGLVVADEAHHAISDSWQSVLTHFDGGKTLGVTATPDRGDKRNLGSYFENIPFEITLFDLIRQGYLSRIQVKSIPLQIDLSTVGSTAGDFDAGQLDGALTPYLGAIARAIREQASFRKVLVFLPLISTSKAFADLCRAEGLAAEHVDGTSENRKQILERFSRNEFDVLCNAMLLTEGFDDPSIDCVVILRPTRSRSLYSQMVGRGTRISPGKDGLLLLDFLWLHERHNLIKPAHLVAKNDEIAAAMSKASAESQEELDLEELERKTLADREKKLQEQLARNRSKASRTIDAMDFCLSIQNLALAEYEAESPWESRAMTSGQADYLDKMGLDTATIQNRGHASKIIEALISRRQLNLATPKQVALMKRLGHPKPDIVGFQAATQWISDRLNKKAVAA